MIPFSDLGSSTPSVNQTKIYELNAHIDTHKPDIFILNETWLKKSISDSEVIKNSNYDVYRNDRSQLSHPTDPSNSKKFRRFGGGVLIAVRSDIDVKFERLSMKRGAEILALEFSVGNKKYVICTVYRVGTLGEPNHTSIMNSIRSFYNGRNHHKIVVIGDFNLSSINWATDGPEMSNIASIDQLFLDSFHEFGLCQLIRSPTHSKGRTLDILLTNDLDLISNTVVHKDEQICCSDHLKISFTLNARASNKRFPKRTVYNFKRANWTQLNEDLQNVPWHVVVDSIDPESAWKRFKDILFRLVNRHIPKVTVKHSFSAPWFDSDCYAAYRSKERAHKKFKLENSLSNELKRDHSRREFRNICNRKMRDNLYNSDDPALITKKFWSHVKSNSKSCRLPECMHLKAVHRSLPADKAKLFNDFFCDQISSASNYDIDFDWTNDQHYNIEFYPERIKDLLAAVNTNKACGPDNIHENKETIVSVGLSMNDGKTEFLTVNTPDEEANIKSSSGRQLKHVKDFKYLGSWIATTEKDIRTRKAKAWAACHKLMKVWKSNLRRSMKIRLFVATVESILLYGSETWTLTESLSKQIDGCYTRMLRMALDVNWKQHLTNKEVYGTLPRATMKIQERRMRLAGHLKRHPELTASSLLLWEPKHGARTRGRPALTYVDNLRKDTGLSDTREIAGLMADRLLWRRHINARTLKPP
ncbi:hypothetical protein ACHWQZ_G019436 [Mnemiopsis leidyi]